MPAVLADPAIAAVLLLYLLGWGVALGLLYTWNATFHHLFQGIAKALTFKIGARWGPSKTIHLGGWADTIDHVAQEWFSSWALGSEIMVGKLWHALGFLFHWQAWLLKRLAVSVLHSQTWIVDDFVPGLIHATLEPFRKKVNKAAAVAAAAAAGLLALRHEQREGAHQQAQTNKAAKAETKHAEHEAAHAKTQTTVHERTIVHEQKVITQVVEVAALPVPFGRTVHNIRRRLGKVEALLGATAMAAAMANVLGLPNPRCLTRGPLGRISRRLCGMSTNALDDLLSLLADVLIISEICEVLPYLEQGFNVIAEPLVGLIGEAGAALCGGDFDPPPALAVPTLSIPALVGAATVAA